MSRPVVIVPPLVSYLAGPPAGPAMLRAAARTVGGDVRVVDLNAQYLRCHVGGDEPESVAGLSGDHAKPVGHFALARRRWRELHMYHLGMPAGGYAAGDDPVTALCYTHEQVEAGARSLARSSQAHIWSSLLAGTRPAFVGVSLSWSAQVVAALALARIVRDLWPGVPVLFGGPHVTVLADKIARDARYGALVDGFVAGRAEATFAEMVRRAPLEADGVFTAGCGRVGLAHSMDLVPCFSDLELYGVPRLILPAQTSVGCAHGRCEYCSYVRADGAYRPCDLDLLEPVIKLARRHHADLALRDAYLVPGRGDAVADMLSGRVTAAACTRVDRRLDRPRLKRWVRGGIRTVELGVETVDRRRLKDLNKRQEPAAVEAILQAAAGLDLNLVLNAMFGWPGQTEAQAGAELAWLVEDLPRRYPDTRFSVEKNLFQLCRGAPMAHHPERSGMSDVIRWPWASVMGWSAPGWRADNGKRYRGHHVPGQREAA